jgi:hypothetical protein
MGSPDVSPTKKSGKKKTRVQTAKVTKTTTSTTIVRESDIIQRDYGLTHDNVEIESLRA